MEQQVLAWRRIMDRYLVWIEILAEKEEEELGPLGPEALLAIRQALSLAPSLLDLAQGRSDCIPILQLIRAQAPRPSAPWLNGLTVCWRLSPTRDGWPVKSWV